MKIFSTWLTINRSCNLACKWCYALEESERNGSDMDVDLAKKLIDLSIEIGVRNFKLIGGEPTIYPYFYEVLEYLISYGADVVIVTNGIILSNKDFCKKIVAYNYSKIHFGISLKGSSEDDYINNCGNKGFALLLDGLKNCDLFGISYSLSYVLTHENIVNLDQFAQNISELGINKTIFFAFCNYIVSQDQSQNNQEKTILIEMDKIFSKKYSNISTILNDKFQLHQTFPLCMCDTVIFNEMLNKRQVNTTCHVHKRNGLIFDTNGSILLCNHLAGFGIGTFGIDYHDSETFARFWNSEYIINLHKRFTSMPSLSCQDCTMGAKCGGGCCVQWFTQQFDNYKEYVRH